MECYITPLARPIASPCKLSRYGSLLLALFLVVPASIADTASPQGITASAESSQTVTLKDGRTIKFLELSKLSENEQEELLNEAVKRSERVRYKEWLISEANARIAEMNATHATHAAQLQRIAEKDATLAAQLQRIAEKKAALTLLDATDAAMKAVLDPKCITDDRLPDAVQRRKEIGAMFDAALQNSHLTSRFSGDTTTLIRSLAEKLRLGQIPKRMSPENFAKWSKEKSKCLVDAR